MWKERNKRIFQGLASSMNVIMATILQEAAIGQALDIAASATCSTDHVNLTEMAPSCTFSCFFFFFSFCLFLLFFLN
jgi:hypothetical protein